MLAFLLLFDRKVWAAVQMRRAPTSSAPSDCCKVSPIFIKFVLKEATICAAQSRSASAQISVISNSDARTTMMMPVDASEANRKMIVCRFH